MQQKYVIGSECGRVWFGQSVSTNLQQNCKGLANEESQTMLQNTHRWHIMICSQIYNAINNMLQIENALILLLILRLILGGVWGSNQHWECLQSHAPHLGWYHRFYRIENVWERTKRKILSKTYFKVWMLPRMDFFAFLKLFHRRQPTWPEWTCFSTSQV